jgi:uncharacterized protein YndB with AHSA1/START domain
MEVTVSRLIKAPKERIWDLLADVEHWPNWAPQNATNRVISHAVVSREGNIVVCDEVEQAGIIKAKHRDRYTLFPGDKLEEQIIDGDVEGGLTVTLTTTPEGTLVQVRARGKAKSFWLRFLTGFIGGEKILTNFWNGLFDQLASIAAGKCSPNQPMYCPSRMLDAYFDKPGLPMEKLVNLGGRQIDIQNLTIYNNVYWKGIYPPDSLAPAWLFQNGFNKKFMRKNGTITGVTSTFDDTVKGQNKLSYLDSTNPAKGILLEYIEPQYSMFYDILKVISDEIVVGKAFTGRYPNGTLLLNFTMARKYNFDFMSAEDHRELFEKYGRVPDMAKMPGEWEGRMVSNASLTPPLFRFWYALDTSGKLSCKWNFMNILKGSSKLELKPKQLLMFDFTNFHDEIRMITDSVMVGRYLPQSTELLNVIGNRDLGLMHFEKTVQGTRPVIYYYIKRVSDSQPPS